MRNSFSSRRTPRSWQFQGGLLCAVLLVKKALVLLSLFLVFHRASALPNFDPFADATANGGTTYTTNTPLAGQINVTGSPWNTLGSVNGNPIEPKIIEGNLSYPNLPPPTGNGVAFYSAVAMSARLNLNGVIVGPAAKAYYSFILKITDISNVPTTNNNNPFAGFSDTTAAQANNLARVGTRVLTKKVGPTSYVLGVSKTANLADMVYDTTTNNVNDVLFIVGSWEVVSGVTNCNLWINPPSSSFGLDTAPAATLSTSLHSGGTTALNSSGVASFAVLCQLATAPSGSIDELRVGTNWSYVTGGDPAIVQNPVSQTLPPGSNAIFSVTARGTPTLGYQWVKDGTIPLSDGGNISGANTATLHVNSISVGDAGSYEVFVTNGLGSFVQSASAQLTLADPAITTQPQSRTNDFGTAATFSVSVSGTAPFTYQWHKEGVGDLSDVGKISGSHTNVLTLTGVALAEAGNYSVTVGNSLGATSDSAMAALTVIDPVILTQPAAVTNIAGSNVTFHVVADGTGAPSFSYQWRKNGNAISDGGNLSGTSTDTLTVSSISSADEAYYSVAVTGASTATSRDASLTVISPVSITAQPNPRTVVAGSAPVFAVGVNGTAPFAYQWLLQGTNLPGATSFVYTVTNAQAADAGGYSVVVSNSLNSVTSAVAALTIAASLHLYDSNLVVIRVGDGAQALSLNGNSMYLDQFAASGSYVNTFAAPERGASAILAIGQPNVQGTTGNITGSGLTRSADGRLMVIAGYNTSLGFGSSLAAASSSDVPRGVGIIDSAGHYTLAVSSTAAIYSQAAFRACVADGTNNYWGCANKGGIYYFGFDDPEASVASVVSNVRSFAVFNGNLYFASAVAGTDGIWKLDGLPRAGAPSTLLFPNGTSTSDMEVSPNGNLIYVADDRAAANGGGILRYEFDGSNWNLAYALTNGLASGARYVGADFSGPNPILGVVTPESENNRLVAIVDTGATATGSTVASAGVNQIFRGVRFGPLPSAVVTPPTLSFARDANNLILGWSGAFILQSATNVVGPYVDVTGATSPHTNSTSSAAQSFFRLRN